MSEIRRIFLLGAGTMAREHARAARASGAAIEIHAADPSDEARASFGELFPEAQLHPDVESMLASPAQEGDLGIIATPPWLHRPQIELVARSGRHILCEKPLLLSSDDIEPVASLLRETGRVLACCSVRMAPNPATLRVQQLVAEGALGGIYAGRWLHGFRRMRSGIEYQPQSPFFLDKSRNGGGVLMDWAPYDLTTLQRVLRPRRVTVVHAALAQPELPGEVPGGAVFDVETHGVATLLYERPDGSRTTIQYERFSGSFERDLEDATLNGTRGSVTWTSMGYQGDITLSLRHAADDEGKRQVLQAPDGPWAHHAPLRSMLDLHAGRPNFALAGGDALFQIGTLRAIYDVAERGEPITVERSTYADLPGTS